MKKQKESNITLSQFANEILSKGAEAVLPQNLPERWLKRIQKMADDFLDINFEGKSCAEISDIAAPIFSSCVTEIVKYQQGKNAELSRDIFIKYSTIYAISITMETVRREAGLNIDPPRVENIFSDKRLHNLKKKHSNLGKFFKRVCLDPEKESEKNHP